LVLSQSITERLDKSDFLRPSESLCNDVIFPRTKIAPDDEGGISIILDLILPGDHITDESAKQVVVEDTLQGDRTGEYNDISFREWLPTRVTTIYSEA
jgi:hypothetical protein